MDDNFVVPVAETSLQRSLNVASTPKEKALKLELHTTNKENKSLKRKIDALRVKEESFNIIEQQYVEALDGMKLLELQTKEAIRSKEKNYVSVTKDLQVIQKKYDSQRNLLDHAEKQLLKTGATAAKVRKMNKKIVYRHNKILCQKIELTVLKQELHDCEEERQTHMEKMTSKIEAMSQN